MYPFDGFSSSPKRGAALSFSWAVRYRFMRSRVRIGTPGASTNWMARAMPKNSQPG